MATTPATTEAPPATTEAPSATTTTIPSPTLLNLTPFNIIVFPTAANAPLIVYPKSGTTASLISDTQAALESLPDGCSVVEPQRFVRVEPPAPPSTLFTDEMVGVIVTMPVAQWLSETGGGGDVWRAIYTADLGPNGVVRNAGGAIIGTRRLCCYVQGR